ncbi:GNAT family N-acetyltransferase [Pseudoalteromonas sp. YIC-656]|uniref:GNAT family N-acetyltransferase n=1 Tax=Pseudoalteromonas pernae TaxID=3118054 RepID=UPI0032421A8A
MPIHISDTLYLTPLTKTDAECIFDLVNSNRAQLREFLYWVDDVISVESARAYIAQRVDSSLPNAHWFKVHFNNKTCGIFAIKSVCKETYTAELGYWLCSSVHGNGLINKIIEHLVLLVPSLQVEVIEFRCLELNHASIKVALKSGARFVQSIPNYMVANNVTQSLNIYQLEL